MAMDADQHSVLVHPIQPEGAGGLRFEIVDEVVNEGTTAGGVERAWNELRQSNPRLFDGPVLLVDREAILCGRLVCRRGSYKQIATHGMISQLGTAQTRSRPWSLGVQGVVVGRDADGDEVVLMGRRSLETRVYGGLWENAPSGTVTPRPGDERVDLGQFVASLREEGLEEIGVDLGASSVRWIALLEDAHAGSIDVVLKLDAGERVNAARLPCPIHEGRWEYVDSAWVPTKRLAEWVNSGAAVSPPTRGLFEFLGWIRKQHT
jgi:hypothetical protein